MGEGNGTNIGEVARQTGVGAKAIRFYESIGLLPSPERGANGYRRYGPPDVERLRFVARARSLGFSVVDVSALLALWNDRGRESATVRNLALRHVAEIEQRISELQSIRATLLQLVDRCHGDARPDCPILDNLAHALPD